MNDKVVRYSKMREEWKTCTKCRFATGRVQVVLGAGNLDAKIMVIGQWPGKDEDKLGIPVQGEGGKWVKAALDVAGIPWESVFFDNILGCQPVGTPKKVEKNICWPRLEETINIVDPALIILMGAEASKYFYGKNVPGSSLAGTWWEKDGRILFSTTHPVEPPRMKSPDAKTSSWNKIYREYCLVGLKAREMQLLPRTDE